MSTETETIEAAFRRASAALDEAWQTVREWRSTAPFRPRVETLSTSLAHPEAFQIEVTLSNARSIIRSDADRATLILLARMCEERGLIDTVSRDRLLKDFTA